MIEISERDYVDFCVVLLDKKYGDLLDFFLEFLKHPISLEELDDQWHDTEYTGQQMLDLEAILYERGLLK